MVDRSERLSDGDKTQTEMGDSEEFYWAPLE